MDESQPQVLCCLLSAGRYGTCVHTLYYKLHFTYTIQNHNIISLAREQQQVNLLSELLIYRGGKKRAITVPKFLRLKK
jgi:hypothetical protein